MSQTEIARPGPGRQVPDLIKWFDIIAERRRVARSGKGLPGDQDMPHRDKYVGDQGTYNHAKESDRRTKKKHR